jgi:hypothetical protein
MVLLGYVLPIQHQEKTGFQHLEEIAFSEHGIQDQQTVYTYNIGDRPNVRMLTPGSIMYAYCTFKICSFYFSWIVLCLNIFLLCHN